MTIKNLTLYLIRHGQSFRNVQSELIGQHPDEYLTAKGEAQAECFGKSFKKNDIDFSKIKIYSSTYRRAKDTCEIACKQFGGKINELVPELVEYSSGDMLDKSRYEVMTPEIKEEMRLKGMSFKFPNGESLYEVETRASIWLEKMILGCNDGDVVAIFSHGMTIKCLLHHIMKFSHRMTWRISLDNTGVCKLILDEGLWYIKYINDTRHLNERI